MSKRRSETESFKSIYEVIQNQFSYQLKHSYCRITNTLYRDFETIVNVIGSLNGKLPKPIRIRKKLQRKIAKGKLYVYAGQSSETISRHVSSMTNYVPTFREVRIRLDDMRSNQFEAYFHSQAPKIIYLDMDGDETPGGKSKQEVMEGQNVTAAVEVPDKTNG